MHRRWFLTGRFFLCSVVMVAGGSAFGTPTADLPQRDLASEVRSVLATRCASCHGPDLAKPKGRFGYVLDLRRIAQNPEMVIPERPDESELWVLIKEGEMPPEDSPQGPLTSSEKEVIRDWIAMGAPVASPGSLPVLGTGAQPPTVFEEPSEPPVAKATSWSGSHLLGWFGRFHLVLLHFPIALVIAALVAESHALWRGSPHPSDSVRYCLGIAAVVAGPTAILGWLLAGDGAGLGSPTLLLAHRWLGSVAAIGLMVASACVEGDYRRGTPSRWTRPVLALAALLTVLTAHLGGLLAHGRDYFVG